MKSRVYSPKRSARIFCGLLALPVAIMLLEVAMTPSSVPLSGLVSFCLLPATGLLAYFLCFRVLGRENIRAFYICGLIIAILNCLCLGVSMLMTGNTVETIPMMVFDVGSCAMVFLNAVLICALLRVLGISKK